MNYACGFAKMLEVVLAKIAEPSPDSAMVHAAPDALTVEGNLLGTVAYMSPEHAEWGIAPVGATCAGREAAVNVLPGVAGVHARRVPLVGG